MKLFIQILFFFLLVTQICFAQWYQQNSGTDKNLYAVRFIDANNGFAVGDSGIILQTTDAGNNWGIQPSETTLPLKDIFFVDEDNGWAVGGYCNPPTNLDVILRTTDGGINWSFQSNGNEGELRSVFFIDQDNGWIVGWSFNEAGCVGTILSTTNGGITWTTHSTVTGLPLNDVCFTDVNNGIIVGGMRVELGSESIVLRTTDGGNTWGEINSPSCVKRGVSFSNTLNGIVVGGSLNSINWGGWIFRTTDGGITWSTVYYGELCSDLNDITFSDENNGWVVGGSFWPSGGDGCILSTNDGGLTWAEQISGISNALSSVFFNDAQSGWAVGANGTILHTTNGGLPVELTSFIASSNGKEVTLNWSTATETNNQGFEILRFAQNDNEWKVIGFVLGFGTTTEPMAYSYTDSKVSTGKYTYRLKQIDFDGSYEYSPEVKVVVSSPLTFTLDQNYPNPFNPTTKIKYSVPHTSQVQIKVFGVLGNEIETLVKGEKPAGAYGLTWNAANLPGGVYFYQLRAGSFAETKKMLLLK